MAGGYSGQKSFGYIDNDDKRCPSNIVPINLCKANYESTGKNTTIRGLDSAASTDSSEEVRNDEYDNMPSPPPPPIIRLPNTSASIPKLLQNDPSAIVIMNKTRKWWTDEMTTLFSEQFLKVLDASEPEESLNINSTTIERDVLKICCSNDETKKWFKTHVPKWTPWKDAQLEVIDSMEHFLVNFTVFIPTDFETSAKSILERLEKQNQKLNTNEWVVRRCSEQFESDGNTLSGYSMLIGIDRESMNLLYGPLKIEIFYCMTNVQFKKRRGGATRTGKKNKKK